jgi:hypothetical protein
MLYHFVLSRASSHREANRASGPPETNWHNLNTLEIVDLDVSAQPPLVLRDRLEREDFPSITTQACSQEREEPNICANVVNNLVALDAVREDVLTVTLVVSNPVSQMAR